MVETKAANYSMSEAADKIPENGGKRNGAAAASINGSNQSTIASEGAAMTTSSEGPTEKPEKPETAAAADVSTTPAAPPLVSVTPAPPPHFAPASPPVASTRHSGIASPEHRRARAVSSSPEGPAKPVGEAETTQRIGTRRAATRASPEKTPRGRASPERLPINGGSRRASPSNSPPPTGSALSMAATAAGGEGGVGNVDNNGNANVAVTRNSTAVPASVGSGKSGVSYFYGGLTPAAAVPASNVAGVAGPGGGGLASYLGGLGFGSWGSGDGGGAMQHQSAFPLAPLTLPPVSPASATSSGRYVFGVSPASAASSTAQGRPFSVSSTTSGSELTYSPFETVAEKEVSGIIGAIEKGSHT